MLLHYYLRFRRKWASIGNNPLAVDYWTNRLRTAELLPIIKQYFNEDELPHVQVETTTDCNYACPFCPQATERRPSRYITRHGFQMVVNQLVSMGFNKTINLAVNTEPFMHPLVVDFCSIISQQLPEAQALIVTNGSLIKDSQLDAMNALKNPPVLYINDYTPNQAITRRMEEWSQNHPGHRLYYELRSRSFHEKMTSRAGLVKNAPNHWRLFAEIICLWPFYCMFIDADLKVFLCCADYQHAVKLGDLTQQDVMTVWRSERYRSLRNKMIQTQRMGLPLCSHCDGLWHRLPEYCPMDQITEDFA